MLARIATYCFVHRGRVVLAWLALIIAAFTASAAFSGRYDNTGSLPGTDSQAALDLLNNHFPANAGEEDQVVFAQVGDDQRAVATWVRSLAQVRGVTEVGALQRAPKDGVLAADFTLADGTSDHPTTAATSIEKRAGPLKAQGVEVGFSGDSFENDAFPATEVVGVIAALVVLLLVLGSILAAGLPIVVALIGIAVSLPLIGVTANLVATPDFTAEVAALIGIGVGIDYALLLLTRFRAALADRRGDVLGATVVAASKAGRSVVIAGTTVAVSLAGLWAMGLSIYDGMAIGCMLAVGTAVAASLTLLPALLGFTGKRIGRSRRAEQTGARGLVRLLERRPAHLVSGGLVLLALLAAPALSMHLGTADAGTDPAGSVTRIGYDLNAKAFGPGTNGPILVTANTTKTAPGSVGALHDALAAEPGVAQVASTQTSADGQAALIEVIPTTGPNDRATTTLIYDLRSDVIAPLDHRSGLVTYVGGETAENIDFAHSTADRLPLFLGGVLAISFLLLLVGFRSVPVALTAVLLNLLSVGAAYGVLTAVFEWGWGAGAIGASVAPIAPWVLPMLFAIVFGLSMDYEVFLLGAIREARAQVDDQRDAVGIGLGRTARVITAAAVIMALVFGTFVTSGDLELKVIGLGLASAVVIDAFVIRLLVVPSLLRLFGARAWWPSREARPVPRHAASPTAGPSPLETSAVGTTAGGSTAGGSTAGGEPVTFDPVRAR